MSGPCGVETHFLANIPIDENVYSGYYKIMRNLVDYCDEYYLQPPTEMWNAQLCSGKGTARGVEMFVWTVAE